VLDLSVLSVSSMHYFRSHLGSMQSISPSTLELDALLAFLDSCMATDSDECVYLVNFFKRVVREVLFPEPPSATVIMSRLAASRILDLSVGLGFHGAIIPEPYIGEFCDLLCHFSPPFALARLIDRGETRDFKLDCALRHAEWLQELVIRALGLFKEFFRLDIDCVYSDLGKFVIYIDQLFTGLVDELLYLFKVDCGIDFDFCFDNAYRLSRSAPTAC
jgi:hypothetical protein